MSAHDVEALGELLDGELSAARRKAVEEHLAACSSCREELERLRGLSRALRSTPQAALPAGFMSRLSGKAADRGGRAPARWALPGGAWSFAAAALLVAVVVMDRARVALSVNDVPVVADDSRLPPTALTEEDVERMRELKPSKKLAAAPGIPLDAITMAGASTPERLGPSNEELHADLERQKKRLGIRRIEPKASAEDDWQKLAAAQAEAADGAIPPAPKISETGKPADLKQAAEEAAAAGKPLPGPERGAPVAAQAAAAPAAAPEAAQGLVIRSEDERQKAWAERGMHMRPPTVRYDRSLLVLVVAPDMSTAVEILGVQTGASGVSVRYRLFPRIAEVADQKAAPVRAYQFRVIPKTDLPVTFDRVSE